MSFTLGCYRDPHAVASRSGASATKSWAIGVAWTVSRVHLLLTFAIWLLRLAFVISVPYVCLPSLGKLLIH